jgi:uncharacterized membrane protein
MRRAMAEERHHSRLAFIDVARGLAVILMLQTHAYDAWLRPELRETSFFRWSQLIGGLPAALFLFLMGVSGALASEKARIRGARASDLVRVGLKRALLLLAAAFAFRFTMFLASDRPEWEAVFRVDILNCLAASLALLTVVEIAVLRNARLVTAVAIACWIAMATPFVWDSGLFDGLPVRWAGYLSGRVENSSFPIFPWAAYAFAGHAIGTSIALFGNARTRVMTGLLFAGLLLPPLSQFFDGLGTLGPRYEYWRTSPNLVLYKTGVLLCVLVACFGFERLSEAVRGPLGAGLRLFGDALLQMGRTSLFIYCVHVDIVYGWWALPKLWRSCEIDEATKNLGLLTLAMLALSYLWTGLKTRTLSRKRQALRAAEPAVV